MANDRIDFSKYLAGMRAERGRAESEEVSRQVQPQREIRSQSEKEQSPDYYERQQKRKERESEYRRERGF